MIILINSKTTIFLSSKTIIIKIFMVSNNIMVIIYLIEKTRVKLHINSNKGLIRKNIKSKNSNLK